MKKRIFCILLASLLLLGCVSFSALALTAEKEFIVNGSFEDIKSDGKTIKSWSVLNERNDYVSVENKAKDGEYAAKLVCPEESGNTRIIQKIEGLKPGGTYVFSAYVFAFSNKGFPFVKIEIGSQNNNSLQVQSKRWVKKEIKFTVPETHNAGHIYLGAYNGAEVLFDAVSIIGPEAGENDVPKKEEQTTVTTPTDTGTKEVVLDKIENRTPPTGAVESVPSPEFIEGRENILQNGDFENDENHIGPWHWGAYKTGWEENQKTLYVKNFGHNSQRSVQITNGEVGDLPYIRQQVELHSGGSYQVSMWIFSHAPEIMGSGQDCPIVFKLEFYSAEPSANSYLGEQTVRVSGGTGGKWMQVIHDFNAPPGTKVAQVYVRQYSQVGTFWVDNMFLCNTEVPDGISVTSDQVFYYSDHTSPGVATAEINADVFPELVGSPIDFRLTKDGTVLAEQKGVPTIDGKASFTYDIGLLTEKQEEYRIEASAGGHMNFWRIYKYDRPIYLGADGVFRKNGDEIRPIAAYNYVKKHWGYGLADAAINVGILSIPTNLEGEELIASMRASLDAAKEAGVYCLIATYTNMLPGGHEANRATTELLAANLHDHPALFGWMNMDEPFLHDSNPHDDLRNTYIAVRNNDPYHPVFTTEQGSLRDSGKYVDIFGVDPYPGDTRDPLSYPASMISNAVAAVDGTRPVYGVLQTFNWKKYWPSENDMRNMIYQNFLAGGAGLGYYKFTNASGDGKDLDETDLWPTLSYFAQNEAEDVYNAFVFDKYPIFSDTKNNEYWAVSFVKEELLHMVILNRKSEKQTVSLPLTSISESHSVGAFTAVCAHGGNRETISGNGTLSVTLEPGAAVVYKITPADASTLSGLSITRFHDLTGYGWAYDQILKLDEKEIINSISNHMFAPGRAITRGDFAMFLIRTLGLTAEVEASSFTDVLAGAHYAKEIAVGQALGILKGVGNGMYLPEAEISRQDLMVICARGMRYVWENGLTEGELTAFSDKDKVSDYAAADIAAMVNAGIVKGNADGTINPLGNATRAEAAVIMDRILTWAENA